MDEFLEVSKYELFARQKGEKVTENKKYYWLKLNKDFFKRHDIRIIEEMENGKDYILFYLKLLLESVNHEGQLRFSDTVPYNEKMLSVITNTNIDIVRSAMKVLIELKMIEILDDSTIYMSEVLKITGSETAAAERMRKSRRNQKLLAECNNVQKCYTEIEIEKEIDIEIDKEKEIYKEKEKSDKPTRTRFIAPTVEEVKAYCMERNNKVDAERFVNYYTSNGWKVGKNKMQDWKSAVRSWEKNNIAKSKKSYLKGKTGDATFNAEEFAKWEFEKTYGKGNEE